MSLTGDAASPCAYMLTLMDAAALTYNAKRSSGRSYRALACDAGVAASTITRIEAHATDPTFSTMQRLLRSCGFELVAIRTTPSRRPLLAELATAWSPAGSATGSPELHWTQWRTLLDRLALHPELVPEAIYVPPPPAGHRVIDTLLAGVAEKLADDAGLLRPSWTETVPELDVAFTPPTRRHRPVPPQLASRGVMIDTESLFRSKSKVGV